MNVRVGLLVLAVWPQFCLADDSANVGTLFNELGDIRIYKEPISVSNQLSPPVIGSSTHGTRIVILERLKHDNSLIIWQQDWTKVRITEGPMSGTEGWVSYAMVEAGDPDSKFYDSIRTRLGWNPKKFAVAEPAGLMQQTLGIMNTKPGDLNVERGVSVELLGGARPDPTVGATMQWIPIRVLSGSEKGREGWLPRDGLWKQYEVRLRTFIPSPAVVISQMENVVPKGTPFDMAFTGDNRRFDFSRGTHRSFQSTVLSFGPESKWLSTLQGFGRTYIFDKGHTATVPDMPDWWRDIKPGIPKIVDFAQLPLSGSNLSIKKTDTFGQVRSATFEIDGANPLRRGPTISASIKVEIRMQPGQQAKKPLDRTVEYRVSGKHDGFPAYEVYINGVIVYSYSPVLAGRSPLSLFPGNDVEIREPWRGLFE